MPLPSFLLSFGLKYVLGASTDGIVDAVQRRVTDHGTALPDALARAHDRAWEAVALALAAAPDSFLDRARDKLRDADLRGMRDHVRAALGHTPTGLDGVPEPVRAAAAGELARLRRGGRLAAAAPPVELAREAAERYADPVGMVEHAHRAVAGVADALRPDAPHLADVLTRGAAGGPPLLAVAFAFFFRREVGGRPELARALVLDHLRRLGERQEQGFDLLAARTAGVLDQIDALFETIEQAVAGRDARLDAVVAKLDELLRRAAAPAPAGLLRVTVADRAEREFLRAALDQYRQLPGGAASAADWLKLGDALSVSGAAGEAGEAYAAAAARAGAARDRAAEAEAEYRRFRAACEAADWAAAAAAAGRAAALAPERFTPFDTNRYTPAGVLGAGGFGVVFAADDGYTRGPDGRPRRVAVKVAHDAGWDVVLARAPDHAFAEADTLSALDHPGIVKALDRGYGDPDRQRRPYVVLEYFAGETLEARVRARGRLPAADALAVAARVAEAVAAAHRVGVLHRDLKPANVMVADDGAGGLRVKVIDFGLAVKAAAARASAAAPAGPRSALDRSLAGSLRYAPPEQRGELDADVGPYSDVYAWGKTCLDLLFGTTDPKAVHWAALPAGDRGWVQDLLERATADDLALRPADFAPVLAALAARGAGTNPAAVELPAPPLPGDANPTDEALAAAAADPDWHVRRAAVGRIGRGRLVSPAARRVAVEALADPEPEVRRAAAAALAADWPAAGDVPVLAARLADPRGEVRAAAAAALGGAGVAARAAVAELVGRLADGHEPSRRAAREALDRVAPDWAASPAALAAVPGLLRELTGPNAAAAAAALAAVRPTNDGHVRALAAALAAEAAGVRTAAADVLAAIGPAARAAVPHLAAALVDPDAGARAAARTALAAVDPDWRRHPDLAAALPRLADRLNHPDAAVRAEAARFLGAEAPLAAAAPPLAAARFDADPAVRRAADEAFARLPAPLAATADTPAAVARVAAAVAAGGPLRVKGLDVLGWFGREAAAHVGALVPLTADADPAVRAAAGRALDAVDPDWRLDPAAVPAARALVALLTTLPDDTAEQRARREAAVGVLAGMRGRARLLVADVVPLLGWWVPAGTVTYPARRYADDRGVRTTPAREVRCAAARVLGEFGPAAAAAVPALVARVVADEWWCAAEAEACRRALDRIDPDWPATRLPDAAVEWLARRVLDDEAGPLCREVCGRLGPRAVVAARAIAAELEVGPAALIARRARFLGDLGAAAAAAVPALRAVHRRFRYSDYGEEAASEAGRAIERIRGAGSTLWSRLFGRRSAGDKPPPSGS